MRRIFWGFCRNWFLIDPLPTLNFEPFRFWLRIRGDIRNRKTTPRLGESGSRLLSDSANRGVADSPTRRIGESLTPRLAESGSRYGESGSGYSNFFKFFITLNS
jgi:hypothetical protein